MYYFKLQTNEFNQMELLIHNILLIQRQRQLLTLKLLVIIRIIKLNFIIREKQMKAPVYIVKPKNIFRHPFNKFDLDKPMNRESQNDDITDYFNYGFNEDTMNIYGKLVKRTIEVLDESINPTYFDAPSQLMRLNDEIPMDFGGFCKFFDTSIFRNPDDPEIDQNMINYHNGERLFKFFIYLAVSKNQNVQYPLIDFVRCMYKDLVPEQLQICDVMDQIQQNFERKYLEVMKKLIEKKNNPGGTANPSSQNDFKTENNKNNRKGQNEEAEGQKPQSKKVQQEQKSSQSSQSQSDNSDSDQSDSQDSDSSDRKRKRKRSSRRSRSRDNNKKANKGKKSRKQDHRRDRDRRDRKKQKIRRKSSRSRDRSRKKEKSKKYRN